jgi:hypothetical protein
MAQDNRLRYASVTFLCEYPYAVMFNVMRGLMIVTVLYRVIQKGLIQYLRRLLVRSFEAENVNTFSSD